jgi:hypothetical protein
LDFHINEQKDKLNTEGIEWIKNLKDNFSADKEIGLKFIGRITALMKEEPEIEKNKKLQQRINDAANHFETKFSAYQHSVNNHPLITEHREAANIINEYLNQLGLAFYTINYFLQYCKQPFSVTTFLQHKLKFSEPKFNLSIYASGKKQSFGNIPNIELYDVLKQWRDSICEQTGMPIYMVANRVTLTEIATYLPLNKKDLLQISGFGKAKVDKYGDDILEAVQNYCTKNNLESNMSSKQVNPKRERKGKSNEIKTDTKTLSYNLFREGKSVAEIAKERNMAIVTIEGHLASFVGNGGIDINKLVPLEKQLLIKAAIKLHGIESYKTLKENLPEGISYGEIRMVVATEKIK